jgi:hypothetical protein
VLKRLFQNIKMTLGTMQYLRPNAHYFRKIGAHYQKVDPISAL